MFIYLTVLIKLSVVFSARLFNELVFQGREASFKNKILNIAEYWDVIYGGEGGGGVLCI